MSDQKALELLEKVSTELTELVIEMEAGQVRGKILSVCEEVDEYLYDSDYDDTVDEYDDDDDEDDDDPYGDCDDESFEDDEDVA